VGEGGDGLPQHVAAHAEPGRQVALGGQRLPRRHDPEPDRLQQAREGLLERVAGADRPEHRRVGAGRAGHSGVTYAEEMPPSTRKVEAVTNDASSEARKATAAASSSGSANRPTGTWTR